MVREVLLGAEKPTFTGRVAYRTTYPASLLKDTKIDDYAKTSSTAVRLFPFRASLVRVV